MYKYSKSSIIMYSQYWAQKSTYNITTENETSSIKI